MNRALLSTWILTGKPLLIIEQLKDFRFWAPLFGFLGGFTGASISFFYVSFHNWSLKDFALFAAQKEIFWTELNVLPVVCLINYLFYVHYRNRMMAFKLCTILCSSSEQKIHTDLVPAESYIQLYFRMMHSLTCVWMWAGLPHWALRSICSWLIAR